MAWLTPNNATPGGTVCRPLFIPDDIGYIMAVTGALVELTKPENWEQYGIATPQETAALFQIMLNDYLNGGCTPVMTPAIGDIKYTLQNGILDDGWVQADGSAVSRTDYAELFALIGTDFGVGDGTTTFNLPDLRDRFPVGAGNLYGRGAYFGEAEVTLTADQIPAHTHGQNLLNNAPARIFTTSTAGGSAAAATNTPAANPQLQTSAAGGGQAHNNIPPAVGLNPYIYIGVI